MGKIFSFLLLARLFGNPWIAIGVFIALSWALDRFTLRYTPGPWAALRRFRARRRLETILAHNPHDRRAELEIGRLHLEARDYRRAKERLDRACESWKEDAVYADRALARIGAGEMEEGARELDERMEANPRLKYGQPWLDAAEIVMKRDPARAKAWLTKFLSQQPGNVKGLYLLSRAQRALGESRDAGDSRAKAWQEYATSPVFKRREARVWAWRANPIRPAMYFGAAMMAIGAVALLSGAY